MKVKLPIVRKQANVISTANIHLMHRVQVPAQGCLGERYPFFHLCAALEMVRLGSTPEMTHEQRSRLRYFFKLPTSFNYSWEELSTSRVRLADCDSESSMFITLISFKKVIPAKLVDCNHISQRHHLGISSNYGRHSGVDTSGA